MTDEQPDAAAAAQSNDERSPALAPLIGFGLVLLLAAVLNPPVPPAADAGPIETWTTFVLAQALIFFVVFGVLVLLFWLIARVVTRQPSRPTEHFGAATLVSTALLLLGVLAQWYGAQRAFESRATLTAPETRAEKEEATRKGRL